mgnify:CR=1 FL=1
MERQIVTALITAILLSLPGAAYSDETDADSVAHGRELVSVNCAPCHSIEETGPSPHPDAPPFRTLSRKYPVSLLEEALAEGIMTGHEDMPVFVAEPEQITDIVAFLESIQEQ